MNKTLTWNDRLKLKNDSHGIEYIYWVAIILLIGMVVLLFSWINDFSAESASDQEIIENSKDRPIEIIPKKIEKIPAIKIQEQHNQSQEKVFASAPENEQLETSLLLDDMIVLLGDAAGNATGNRLSHESLAEIQRSLRTLSELGPAASPDIRKFLNSGEDILFKDQTGKEGFGFPSLRLALIEILSQLEDDEDAELAFLEVLHSTMEPMEIAAVSLHLEEFAPDYYRHEILNATQNALFAADSTGLEGRNVGPLFQVLQKYSDEDVVATLEEVPPLWWGQYASIALANLSDGKGIPGLIKTLQSSDPHKNLHSRFALKMLAQAATDHVHAGNVLAETVGNNIIPEYLWPEIAALAAGTRRFHIGDPNSPIKDDFVKPISVNKNIAYTPGGYQVTYSALYPVTSLTMEKTELHLSLLDELLSKTSNPIAIQSLEQMHIMLTNALKEPEF